MTTAHNRPELLTLDQVAGMLCTSRDTVRRDARLEKIKVGPRSIRIKATDVDRLLGTRKHEL